jgi:signal transduction histidine kinase
MNTQETAVARFLSRAPRLSAASWGLIAGWALIVGGYCIVSLTVAPGRGLTAFGDIFQCLAALFAFLGLLMNASLPEKRTRLFWLLLALGCFAWLVGQSLWTYFEVVLRKDTPDPFIGDVILFLHPVPMIGALALKPHDRREDLNVRTGYLDFSLLLVWWVYLYLFVVIPWQYITPNVSTYGLMYDHLAAAENMLLAVGFAMLMTRSRGKWREVYAHSFSASLLYAAGSYITNRAITRQDYYTGSVFDLPLVASFIWFGTAGFVAYALKPQREAIRAEDDKSKQWPSFLAKAAVFSIPLMALWTLWFSSNPAAVRTFRFGVTQVAALVVALLIFSRQRLVDHDRIRLLERARESFDNLKHVQEQMIQTEKLVSLGQLAAGAAHEINNPLAGILGYSDLLVDDPELGQRQRIVADKIRTLARRIKTLVTSLLSFARRVPSEKTHLEINQVIATALHLSNLDLRGRHIEVESLPTPELPVVRGDANQILQVFFNLISNAVDALEEVGGGKLMIRTWQNGSKIMVQFSDTGAGIKFPHQVFDPFFTTKPVGKGTGLGLSICYGIMQEHGGKIECFNRPEGGATFLVEFPAETEDIYSLESPIEATSKSN